MLKLLRGLLGVGLVAAGVAGCQATRAGYESAPYRVVRTEGRVELRTYPALQLAETKSGGDDFMRLFRYISRGNAAEQKIAMTTPVFLSGEGTTNRRMAFVLPETLTEPPAPAHAEVRVQRLDPATYAVLRFRGGQQGPDGPAAAELRAWMAAEKLPALGDPMFAYFDPPWIPGFLCRNEVMIPTEARVTPLTAMALPSKAAGPAARPALGINLSGPADWNTELPFVDVFRFARAWISQKQGAGWGQGPPLDLDEHGWVKRLEPDSFAETPLCTIEGGHYPSGDWTVLWEGDGRIELSKGRIIERAPGRMVVSLDSRGGGFFLRLLETNPVNPVRHIRVLMPGFTAGVAAENPWHPDFLERWRGTACVRFMDFQETNNSKQRRWSDRPRPEDATFTRRGIPVELLCDLANRLAADAWFCLPHEADDDYVREFARLVKGKLDPERRVYVEYSNEVWNGQFQQSKYATEQGQTLGLADKGWEAAWRYTAQRSMEIFRLWEETWGGRERLVRVLSTQAGNSHVAKQIVSWKDAGGSADALAIAPYISMNIPKEGRTRNADDVARWSVDRFLDDVETNALPECIRWMAEHRAIADEHGLKLIGYEAGQHFVGVAGGENHEALTRLLHAANAHPRLAEIYRKYYAAWETNGGDLLCHFSSVGEWSKWGSWGLLQFADDDPGASPKFIATMQWAQKLGQAVTVP